MDYINIKTASNAQIFNNIITAGNDQIFKATSNEQTVLTTS